ncbi:MAG: amidohydrolase family protein [Dehalococcoidia bacterium]
MYCIDVHHHIVPQHYADAIGDIGALGSSGKVPNWSVQGALELMDEAGIDAGITSLSSRGVLPLNAAEANKLARWCNEFAAKMMSEHPGRFGMFATIPLQTMAGALTELAFAYDELRADGICLLSNYDGSYLGDAYFWPLYEELNRRAAVVFVHPASPASLPSLGGMSPSMLEFPFDTTRAAASLLFSGVLSSFPAIRWILSHAGGATPYLAGRLALLSENRPDLQSKANGDVLGLLKKLYFDSALSTSQTGFKALRDFVPDTQLLFGTDYPFGPKRQMLRAAQDLKGLELPPETTSAIRSSNALRLFPRFGKYI